MAARSASLRTRLLLLILCPLVLVSALLGVWRFELAKATAQELFDRGLLAAALAISRDVAISEGDALSPRTRQLISDAGGGEVFYHVTGPGGIYVTGYAYPPTRAAESDGEDPSYSVAQYRGEPVRVLRMSEPTTIGNLTGDTVVTVWQRAADRDSFARALAWRAAAIILALLAALVIVVWFGVTIGLRPLIGLREAIERRSPDDLGRIQRPVPVEVSGIVETLNRLFGQVENDLQAHQAFISDAAHQLRNPASAILSLAETLPGVKTPAERRQREQELVSAARKSARLAEKLLSLERLRYGAMERPETFELRDVARQVCADRAAEVLARDIRFEFDDAGTALPVRGDPLLVAEAIGNLIDNALRHGGPTLTSISVHTFRDGARQVVEVRDDGRGLSSEQAALAFRRFGQLDGGGGAGLGLSIVREVARAHGGDATVADHGPGASVRLSLPAQEG